jgi:hypothetical protein
VGMMLTAHPLLVPRLRKSRSYTSCNPDAPLWSVTGPLYLFIFVLRLKNCKLLSIQLIGYLDDFRCIPKKRASKHRPVFLKQWEGKRTPLTYSVWNILLHSQSHETEC